MSDLIVQQYRRGIEEVTEEIREETAQFLRAAIRIGRLLFEAKAMIAPGDWGRYIEEELPFSHSWANNYMKLYKEYGSEQLSVFGDSQAFMNLRPTQALELLRLPAEEREEFVQTHDVENLSTRQLRQEIQAELDKALEKQKQLEQQLVEAQNQTDGARQLSAMAQEEASRLRLIIDQANADREKEAAEVTKLKEKLDKAKAAEKKAKDQLKQLQEDPRVPDSVMEQMRKEVEMDAAKQATEAIRKELDAALAKADEAAKSAQAAQQQLEAARKAAKLSDPRTVAFKVKFEKLQADYKVLMEDLAGIRKDTPELAEGLTRGVRALLELWQQEV